MWKAPDRPKGEITQRYNDGMLTVYTLTDSAAPGYQPKPELTQKITLRYEERRLGIQRYYAAAQSQQRIERVLQRTVGSIALRWCRSCPTSIPPVWILRSPASSRSQR